MREITDEKLEKYLKITKEALDLAKEAHSSWRSAEVFDMADRYYRDALHFKSKGDFVNAFAAVSYSHGWLDCGALLGLFNVKDNRLFTVDDEPHKD
ncbi:MAG: DUF357 domain-containing protein [Candidatus Woesearchaeota archaeon]